MDIFKNAERSVSSYSFNKKDLRKIDIVSDAYVGNEALRRIDASEKAVREAAEAEKRLAHEKENERIERVVNNSLTESRIMQRMNQLSTTGKTELFKSILFEMLYCSLPIDNDFLLEHASDIKAVIDEYVNNNGGFAKLTHAAESTSSELLKRMKTLCESTTKKVCERKLGEMRCCEDPNMINFDMTEPEKDIFKYGVQDLNVDEISDLIKQKVITVITDAKKRELKNEQLIADIEEDLKANNDVTDEESLKEAMNSIVVSSTPIEHATLFNALVRSTYRSVLTENVAITSSDKDTSDEYKDTASKYDIDATIDDINNDHTLDAIDSDNNTDVAGIEIDMDTIITEAITKYTLMEMLYTVKLENYTAEEIRKMSEKMVNPK